MLNLVCDDYTRVILTQTLAFEQQHARYGRNSGRPFTDYLLGWQTLPNTQVEVSICPADVEVDEETGLAVAKDISWARKQALVEIRDHTMAQAVFNYLPNQAGRRPPENLHNWWYNTYVKVAERPFMVGGLINHGTIREPQWGSHS